MVFRVSVAKPSSVYVRGACNRKVRASVGRTAWCVACGAGKRAAREGRSRRPRRATRARSVAAVCPFPTPRCAAQARRRRGAGARRRSFTASRRITRITPIADKPYRPTGRHRVRHGVRVFGRDRSSRPVRAYVRRNFGLRAAGVAVRSAWVRSIQESRKGNYVYFLTRARSKKSQFHTCRTWADV